MAEFMAIALFISICLALMSGYPVAFTLGGMALLFAGIGVVTGSFDVGYLHALPNRIFGIMNNQTMLAVPLFVFMGVMLEKSRVAEDLLESMSRLFGTMRGGLAISVCVVGALLAVGVGMVSSGSGWARGFGFVALIFACVNIFGGFLVTQRMLAMYKKKQKKA